MRAQIAISTDSCIRALPPGQGSDVKPPSKSGSSKGPQQTDLRVQHDPSVPSYHGADVTPIPVAAPGLAENQRVIRASLQESWHVKAAVGPTSQIAMKPRFLAWCP